jgi:hypothetical protein
MVIKAILLRNTMSLCLHGKIVIMIMLPKPGEHAGDWGDMLNEYLLHEHNPDGTHRHKQKISLPITIQTPSASEFILWRAPAKAQITAIFACRQGGIGVTINARKMGGDNHLAHDLSLSTVDSWLDGGPVINAQYNAGDTLVAVITNVAGEPDAVTIQIEVEYV